MNVIVIDNYDSFTFNLVHLIHKFTTSIEVYRNDEINIQQIKAKNIDAILISPGPCVPQTSGVSIPVIRELAGHVPIFGVCLGMQAIAVCYQYHVSVSNTPIHGKTSTIRHNFDPLFNQIPELFEATRYHSLIVQPGKINNKNIKILALSEDDNMVMSIADTDNCVYGVQFHPESIASQYGETVMQNFFAQAKSFNQNKSKNISQRKNIFQSQG